VSASVAWLVAAAAERMDLWFASASAAPAAPVLDPLIDDPLLVPDDEVREDLPWLVIVWDDPVNLMVYVVMVLRRVFGFGREKAERLMLQVHNEGRAIVASEAREQAELHVAQLHGYGLLATMERQD
jgi:ATP-dependent Clp protease adaptor protein ClpS